MQVFRASELVPPGFVVENMTSDDNRFVIVIRAAATVCRCPSCGAVCGRVHSRYWRTVADLPAAGRRAALILRARRFFCDDTACERRIFTERFEGVVETRARRTTRLNDLLHCLAIALGGRPAVSLSRRLNVEVSNDTLLRIVRRRGVREFPAPSIIGIDDWAWRRNHRYGTLICDLERRRTIGSRSCPIGSRRQPRPGWRVSRRFRSSPAIVAAAMLSPRYGRSRTRSRSLTAGI